MTTESPEKEKEHRPKIRTKKSATFLNINKLNVMIDEDQLNREQVVGKVSQKVAVEGDKNLEQIVE